MENLSTKEINYINDLLSWELLSAKKSYQHANQEQNPARKQAYINAVNTHQQNYALVLNFVDTILKNQGGQMQS